MTTRLLSLALAAAVLTACGSSPTTEPAAQPRAEQSGPAQPAPVDQVASLSEPEAGPASPSRQGPRDVSPVEGETDAGEMTTPPLDPAPPAQGGEGEADEPAEEAEEPATRAAELGRPDWWFDGVRRSDDRVALCAEAGGETVREARRAAINLARERLDRELGAQTEREAVSMAMVLPLPAADAPGAARYIGYVTMEARLR